MIYIKPYCSEMDTKKREMSNNDDVRTRIKTKLYPIFKYNDSGTCCDSWTMDENKQDDACINLLVVALFFCICKCSICKPLFGLLHLEYHMDKVQR